MPAYIQRWARWGLGVFSFVVLAMGCRQKVIAPPEPPIAVRRGDDAFRYEDYDVAIGEYRNYLDQTEQDEYTARILYKSALAQYRLGRYRDTLATLDELADRYPDGSWVQVEALRGDAAREVGRPLRAIKAWDDGWELGSDNDRRKLQQRIVAVARGLDNVALAQAQRSVDNDDVRDLLERQVSARQPDLDEPMPEMEGEGAEEIHAAAPHPSRAEVEDRRVSSALTPPEAAEQARRPPSRTASAAQARAAAVAEPEEPLEDEMDDRTAPVGAKLPPPIAKRYEPPRTEPVPFPSRAEPVPFPPPQPYPSADAKVPGEPKIGCLLPLSGPSQEFGQQSLRGLRLIFGDRNDRLIVRDTGSDPATAVSMFNQLAHDPAVVAIIGPLRSDDAEAIAPRARQAQVPLLLLSQRDGLAGGSVLQVGMTRSRLVGTLLDYAMNKVRMRRFGILYPEDTFGKEYLTTFRSEVERRGGTVVGVDGYSPGTHALSAGVLKRWRHDQHLQAIFLPDNVTAAQPFAHFLQREMPDVTLLGVHGWESLAQDSENLNGVLFSDGFYGGSNRPGTRQFVDLFQQTYNEEPGTLEAQAYDAGLVAQHALESGARSRVDVLYTALTLGPIDGATGELVMGPTGPQRPLFLLQLYDGKLEELSGNAG